MARAAVGWGVRDLAKNAGVAADTVSRLERGEESNPHPRRNPRRAGRSGVIFIEENGEGAGVRLRKR
ncbi:MAG: helix-turn-helix domain-containing protein [Alphaproteobacteria bacterium]|nr:helix-turn-helix domain-containing protein [Alphaproteobacteria bacterium]